MKVIGVTGGVGAGKSALLHEIENRYNCRVIFSDDVANEVKLKGMPAYDALVELLGTGILDTDSDGNLGEIDHSRMAAAIFGHDELLAGVNNILHPATNSYIKEEIDREEEEGRLDFLFIEAALLIENGYKDIVDEMWYIYADEDTRRARLKAARGYSDDKITRILAAQLSDDEFRDNCDFVVDNSGRLDESLVQIQRHLDLLY